MNKRKAGKRVGAVVFALAILLATIGFPRVADAGIKQKACNSVGCPDQTDLVCTTGEIEVSTPFISGKISITCYEPKR